MNRSSCCNRHRFPPVPTASLYSPKRRSQESRQAHTQKHHTRRRGAGTASRSLPPRAHSCRPLSVRTRSSRAHRISAAWSSIPVRAAARVSDSSSTSTVNRIATSSTRIGPIFTIGRCADQNPSVLMHCSQQQSCTTPSCAPATASFRNDNTLILKSTTLPRPHPEPRSPSSANPRHASSMTEACMADSRGGYNHSKNQNINTHAFATAHQSIGAYNMSTAFSFPRTFNKLGSERHHDVTSPETLT